MNGFPQAYYDPGSDEVFIAGNRYVRADDDLFSTCPACAEMPGRPDDFAAYHKDSGLAQAEEAIWQALTAVRDARQS